MIKFNPSKINFPLVGGLSLCLIIAASLLCSNRVADGKPIEAEEKYPAFDKDPILALPSDLNQQQQVQYLQLPYQQPPSSDGISDGMPTISYIQSPPSYQQLAYHQEPTLFAAQQQQQQQQQQSPTGQQGEQPMIIPEVRQEVSYVVRPENQIISLEPQQNAEAMRNNAADQLKHEYISISGMDQMISVQGGGGGGEPSRNEYPGEIIYLGQNGELNKFVSGSNNQQQDVYSGTGQDSSKESISNLAGMISGSSGVPATILTEVPAKDMPQHVLEKLKREYGIKVVATREYPGANLVINCDEDSSQGAVICSKQQLAFTTTSANGPYSISNQEDSRLSTLNVANEQQQPNSGSEPNYVMENTGYRAQSPYSTFGSRNLSLINEEYDTNARAELETLANVQKHSTSQAQPTKTEGSQQQDSESGFDVQPTAASTSESMEARKQ